MRESAAAKGRRYLVEGRVSILSVTDSTVVAIVRGDGTHHRVTYRAGTWHCTCPARSICSHRVAVGLVVSVDLEGLVSTTR